MSGDLRYKCLCGSAAITVLIIGCIFLVVMAFPIAEIALGVAYLHDCPVAPLLPVYIIVLGVSVLLMMGMIAVLKLCPAVAESMIWSVCILSLVLFIFIWFIYGTYLVYSIYPPNYIKRVINSDSSRSSNFTPTAPDYTKNTIDPGSSNNSSFTTMTPDYTMNTSSNSSIFTPTTPDNKSNFSSDQNQNQSLPSFNQTMMIPNTNQTLMNLIQTLALGSSNSTQTYREYLNAPQTGAVEAVAFAPYCDRTLYLFVFWTTTLIYVSVGITCSSTSASRAW